MLEAGSFQRAFGALLRSVQETGDPALDRALAVHRNTVASAALGALIDNYPVLDALVGRPALTACASGFFELSPPGDPRLCLYGAGFAEFVADWAPFVTVAYLASVAALERLVTEALFAPDAAAIDPGALGGDIDPRAPLILHPATRVGSFDIPAASIWLAHQDDAPDEAMDMLRWQPEAALVTRPRGLVEVRCVDQATLAFLSASTIGEAAIAASHAGGDVARIFSTILTAGALSGPLSNGALR